MLYNNSPNKIFLSFLNKSTNKLIEIVNTIIKSLKENAKTSYIENLDKNDNILFLIQSNSIKVTDSVDIIDNYFYKILKKINEKKILSYNLFFKKMIKILNEIACKFNTNYIYCLHYLKNNYKSFIDCLKFDIENMINTDNKFFKIKSENYPQYPKSFRKYKNLDNYKYINKDIDINHIVKTDWKMKDVSLIKESSFLENENDYNHQINNKLYQNLGKDIELKLTWGFDIYSRNILLLSILDIFSNEEKLEFLEFFKKYINFLSYEGWNLYYLSIDILKQKHLDILHKLNYNDKFNKIFKYIKKLSKIKYYRKGLKLFSKGIGIICTNKLGLKKDLLITEYFGEIYSPFDWFTKQDLIKSFYLKIKKNKKIEGLKIKNSKIYSLNNPEFYNIMLEKYKNDEKGSEIYFIDPVLNGNIGSRLSHSCIPNCLNYVCISDKKYTIAMFLKKKISFGTELTFDYGTCTDSEKESKNSICLCGEEFCYGLYMRLINKNLNIFGNNSLKYILETDKEIFLKNISNCLKSSFKEFNEKKDIFLFDNGIKNIDYYPKWLKNWIFYTLKLLKFENIKLLEIYNNKFIKKNNNYYFKSEIDYLYEQRIQNLIISLDKIKKFLYYSLKNNESNIFNFKFNQYYEKKSPIKLLKIKELKEFFINNNKLSIKCNLKIIWENLLKNKHIKKNDLEEFKNILNKIHNSIVNFKRDLIIISEILKNLNEKYKLIIHPSLSIIIFFLSFTFYHFTSENYNSFDINFNIRECDLTNPHKYYIYNEINFEDEEKVILKSKKSFGSSYLWGQMTFWSKQTIDKPDSSLSAAKRGTISYPELLSIYNKSILNPSSKNQYSYPFKNLDKWLDSMVNKPSDYWPIGDGFSYNNKLKVYGSFLLDSIILKKYFDEQKKIKNWRKYLILSYNKKLEQKLQLFDSLNNLFPNYN